MIRLALRVRADQAELVLAELLELAPGGVEEVDPGDGMVEYAVYGAPGELPGLPDLRAAAGEALVEVSTSEVADDWGERWRDFHRPVVVGVADGVVSVPELRVRPPWEPAQAPAAGRSRLEIVIDPAQAFGTGAHATTRLCLELLLERASVEAQRGAAVDVGCGSGVLAIASALLGWGPVVALDNERESVQATKDNAASNGVALEAALFDLRAAHPPPTPLVLANLLRPLLLELSRRLPAHTPRDLIAGGLLEHEADEVAGAFADAAGLAERQRRTAGGWAALWLRRG